MPTLILLDTSLSMLRSANVASDPKSPQSRNSSEEIQPDLTLISLAQYGLDILLEHIQNNCKLEHVALLTFTSYCELVCPFSRDIAQVREAVSKETCFGKSFVKSGLLGVAHAMSEYWGSSDSFEIELIIVTDGGLGQGSQSLTHFLEHPYEYAKVFPFNFKGRVSVIYVNHTSSNSQFNEVKMTYEKLISISGLKGNFIYPEGDLSLDSVTEMFKRVIGTQYQQYVGTLRFGSELKTKVFLCPPPSQVKVVKDFEIIEAAISDSLDIKGFMSLADVASPPVRSRHLMLPWTPQAQTDEEGRIANLCVFLQGALKMESMCALVQVSSNWYGILFSCSDTKKKSNLMLALFEPGSSPIPWLGDFDEMGPLEGLNTSSKEPFSIKGSRTLSYSTNPVVWIKQSSLHSDIQKILRHARKLPDKSAHFYKELNRLKYHALTIGFHELLEGIADTLEKEIPLLPTSSHPDCARQLSHAVNTLKSLDARNVDYTIRPFDDK